jgi:hypothetical protein
MKFITSFKRITALGLLAISLLATACGADPAAKLNSQGNDAYAEQAYLEAVELYQNAQIEHPELAQPYYNAANALYREGQYEQALAQMQQALLYADADLAQHSYFNLGNNFFNAQDLETAVQSYIQALLLNPDDADAKYNLELALNQQQQQEQEQEQQQEQEQEQNQDQQQQEQQGGEGEQDQQQDQQQEQAGENGDQQNDQQQEGQEGQDGDQQQNENQNGDQQNEGEEGEPQEQQNQNGQPNQPGQEDGDEQEETMAGLQPGEKLSQEQAEQLLAAIAGNAQTLQERLGQILVVPGPPPSQDW